MNWVIKILGLVSQQVWHDKDPFLLKGLRCQILHPLMTMVTPKYTRTRHKTRQRLIDWLIVKCFTPYQCYFSSLTSGQTNINVLKKQVWNPPVRTDFMESLYLWREREREKEIEKEITIVTIYSLELCLAGFLMTIFDICPLLRKCSRHC